MEECYLEFKISGLSIPIEEIVEKLSLKPDCIRHKGEYGLGKNFQIPYKNSSVRYKFPLRKPWNIEYGIKKILTQLTPNQEYILSLSQRKMYVELSVVAFMCHNTPIFTIPSKLLWQLGKNGINFDADLILTSNGGSCAVS